MMVDAETDEKTISLNDTTTSTQRGGVNISQYSRKGSLSTDRSQMYVCNFIYICRPYITYIYLLQQKTIKYL